MMEIDPKKGIIVSYQRSGINWVRYCIEFLTGLRVAGRTKLLSEGELAVYRTHDVRKNRGPDSTACAFFNEHGTPIHGKVVLLLRDYRESFARVAQQRRREGLPSAQQIREGKLFNFPNYFENLKAFDEFTGPKLLVRYEALVDDFAAMLGILDFLGLPYTADDFDVELHRQKSIDLYDNQAKAYTKDNPRDFSFHQRGIPPPTLCALNEYIEQNYADLAQKYLDFKG